METKHTKGEWKLKTISPYNAPLIVSGNKTICDLTDSKISLLQKEANAKLIAAAPINFEQNVLNVEFMKRLMQMDYIPKGELAARIFQSEQAIEKATK